MNDTFLCHNFSILLCRLEVENIKPTAKAGLFLIKETKFLIMIYGENGSCELTVKLNNGKSAYYFVDIDFFVSTP